MSQRHRFRILSLIAGLCLSHLTSSSCDRVAVADDPQNAETALKANPSPSQPAAGVMQAGENFSLSASVPKNYDLEILFRSLTEAIGNHESALVTELISQIRSNDQAGFVEVDGVLHMPHHLLKSIIQTMPVDLVTAYRRRVYEESNQALQAAIQDGDQAQLLEVVSRFPLTQACTIAQKSLLAQLRDAGQSGLASEYAAQILRDFEKTVAQRDAETSLLMTAKTLVTDAPKNESSVSQRPQIRNLSAASQWEVSSQLSGESLRLVEQGHHSLRENGLSPFSPWTLSVVDGNLITVSPTHLEVRERSTGALIWNRPLPHYGAKILSQLEDADNPLRSWNLTRAALFRVFGESLYSRFTAGINLLYLVERDRREEPQKSRRNKKKQTENRLVALDIQTGKKVWSSAETGQVSTICSPPALHGDNLLLLVENPSTKQLKLVAINPVNGHLKRELVLGNAAKAMLADNFEQQDDRRLGFACPILISGLSAYCTTSAGMLVAVDLFSWKVDWVYRYPRDDVAHSGTGLLRPDLGLTGFQWWNSWHEVQLIEVGDFLVFASPESESLSLIQRSTGQLLWTIPRHDALYVAATGPNTNVVLVGEENIRAVSFQSGETLWESPLNMPAGRGFQNGHEYLLPDSEYGWTAVDLKTGGVRHSNLSLLPESVAYHFPDLTTPRNLIRSDNEVYEVSFRGLRKLFHEQQHQDLSKPISPTNRFLIAAEKQNWSAATGVLPQHPDEIMENTRLEKTVEWVLSQDPEFEFSSLSSDEISFNVSVNLFCRSFKLACEKKDWPAIEGLLKEEFNQTIAKAFLKKRRSRVRVDLWVLSTLQEMFQDKLQPAERLQLVTAVQKAWQHRLLDNPSEEEFLRELMQRGGPPVEISLSPLSPATSPQQVVQRQLVKRKTELSSNDFMTPSVPSHPAWPNRTPRVTQQQRPSSAVYFRPVPMRSVDGTCYDLMNLEIEYPGHRAIRFDGLHWQRPWAAYLPSSNRPLRMERELIRGWGADHFVLLQVGSEVYGISPFDKDGNRGARMLWPSRGQSIDTLGNRSNQLLSFQSISRRERIGYPRSSPQRMNEFGMHATAVGPVRASYFCVQQQGMLVAYETATGQELWRRYDLPRQANCIGNETHVVVMSVLTSELQVMHSRDGSDLDSPVQTVDPGSILESVGVNALRELVEREQTTVLEDFRDRPVENLSLQLQNLVTGQVYWQRSWKEAAVPFTIDGRWFGIYQTNGKLELLNILNGEVIAEHQIGAFAEVRKIACHVGQNDLLLLISEELSDEKILNANQSNSGYRKVLANGPLLCLDRSDGSLLWQRRLNNSVFPLDQPVDLPVFVTAGSRFPDEPMDDQTPGSRIELYNRHNGERLYHADSFNPTPHYRLTGHRESETVQLMTRDVTITVDFTSEEDDADAE